MSTGILLGDPYKPTGSRWLSRVLVGLGVALSLIAAGLTYIYASTARTTGPLEVATVPVVVAARDIEPRTALAEGDLKVVQMPRDVAPPSALADKAAAVGLIATVPLSANEPLFPTKVAKLGQEGLISVMPPGTQPTGNAPRFRAVSFSVPDSNAAGGAIAAGDHVDLLYPLSAGLIDAKSTDFVARVIAENITVLAKSVTTYTLRIDVDTAERLAALQAGGTGFQLLLRAPGDDRPTNSSGASFIREGQRILR